MTSAFERLPNEVLEMIIMELDTSQEGRRHILAQLWKVSPRIRAVVRSEFFLRGLWSNIHIHQPRLAYICRPAPLIPDDFEEYWNYCLNRYLTHGVWIE